jgi:hypothetical protein
MKSLLLVLPMLCWLTAGCAHLQAKHQGQDTGGWSQKPFAAKINGHDVYVIYDTGASSTILERTVAPRLGITIPPPDPKFHVPPGQIEVVTTDVPCQLTIGNETTSLHPAFYHFPWFVRLKVKLSRIKWDGMIGWPDLKDNIWVIDGGVPALRKTNSVPVDSGDWLKLPIYPGSGVLALEISHPNGKPGVLTIDTGGNHCVVLAAALWRDWSAANPYAFTTHHLYYMPGTGLTIDRTMHADRLDFGPFSIPNVTVRQANQTEAQINGDGVVYEGALGMEALKRLILVVDGKNGMAYLQVKPASRD